MGRIGTGEFTDSLIWEPWTDLNPWLVERFAGAMRRAVAQRLDRVRGRIE
jgi:hypothetical protein